jgi:dolichyl-diphosphooligosaccharide--protein glycosyltransferase
MSWWDYGYQLNGIAERISIADGNTWNHEHIALLGKCLISNETASWEITRHLADYVLIWTTRYAGGTGLRVLLLVLCLTLASGMMGDDLAKSPHMANIGGSVYHDVPREGYWVDREDNPSPLMRQSLLYKMHTYKIHKNHNPVIEKCACSELHLRLFCWKCRNIRLFIRLIF